MAAQRVAAAACVGRRQLSDAAGANVGLTECRPAVERRGHTHSRSSATAADAAADAPARTPVEFGDARYTTVSIIYRAV